MWKRMIVMFCAIWYHLYNLKNVKNTHGGMLLLVKFKTSNTRSRVIFTFLKLYKWYQIAQRIHICRIHISLFSHVEMESWIVAKARINLLQSHFN